MRRSRALVIAAQEKYFYLYSLKAATTLAQELDQAETIMPVEAVTDVPPLETVMH